MSNAATGTMPRSAKGPVLPPPVLDEPLATVADAVAGWPGVVTTVHWNLFEPTVVDGADFYYGEEELGHIHLDGSIHLATSPELGRTLIADGLARRFRYQAGWVCEQIQRIGPAAAIALFQRNYERLSRAT